MLFHFSLCFPPFGLLEASFEIVSMGRIAHVTQDTATLLVGHGDQGRPQNPAAKE